MSDDAEAKAHYLSTLSAFFGEIPFGHVPDGDCLWQTRKHRSAQQKNKIPGKLLSQLTKLNHENEI